MLYYELKKLFGKKRCIVLLFILSSITCFMIIMLYQMKSNYYNKISPFEEFLSYYWLYGLSYLYIIIFFNISVFPLEEKNAMSQILLISQCGREKLAKTKLTISLIVTNILLIWFIVSSFFGYLAVFSSDFHIPITENYDTIYNINSIVATSGDVFLICIISFIVTANFTAILSIYLSVKIKNTYFVCILLFTGCFMTIFSLNPEFGIFFSLMPLGNYIVTADSLKVRFVLANIPLTIHSISLVVDFILICILTIKIKNVYRI